MHSYSRCGLCHRTGCRASKPTVSCLFWKMFCMVWPWQQR